MTLCDTDRARAIDTARESFEWYPKTGARQIATVAEWMAEQQQDLGNYGYAADMGSIDDERPARPAEHGLPGRLGRLSSCGTPADCIEAIRRYQEAGVDTLLCLVNPYKIPHEAVMRTIELMGTEVLPQFR